MELPDPGSEDDSDGDDTNQILGQRPQPYQINPLDEDSELGGAPADPNRNGRQALTRRNQ